MSGLVKILKGQIFQYTKNRNMRNERVKRDIYNKFFINFISNFRLSA